MNEVHMKTLLTAIILFSSQYSLANTTECFIQAKSPLELSKRLHTLEASNYFTGEFQDALTGELDPHALGDGGLILINTIQGGMAIYESNEYFDSTHLISEDAKSGSKFIAVKKSCVGDATYIQTRAMKDLATDILNLDAPTSYFYLR
jgi:hypothetical protein